jgi:CheY-like chemotaxis protein
MPTTRRILVIDDEEDIREVAQAALEEMAGWTVEGASSAAEGLATAAAEPPDAILLDVMMPGTDGFEVLVRLKADARTAGVPVILLTAKVQVASRRLSSEAAGVILKPFDPLMLASQVAQLLGWEQPALVKGA